jgi:raffinose/stachyose/melibiose transport system substrate-binding protein
MVVHRLLARTAGIMAGAVLLSGSLAACSGSDSKSGGHVEISFLTSNDPLGAKLGRAFVAAFESANPNIKVKLNTQPVGSEGDNLIKTELSTGTMDDVFNYNTGSLLQALNPDEQLVDLSGEPWVKDITADYKSVVSTDKGLYGAPIGTSFAGGVLYNKKVYAKLGLSVPTSWAEFMANSQKIKNGAPGVAPIIQAFGDNWTAQIFVLADFGNVARKDPNWATNYTRNKAKYVDQPALSGFLHQEETFKAGLYNKDFPSITNEQALKMLADGKGAQYPILTNAVPTIQQDSPDKLNDIGFFALPADDAANTQATIWEPNGLYIPKTTEGAKLDAAKKFISFVTSSAAGCKVQDENGTATGPYVTSACKLSGTVPPVIEDVNKYFTEKRVSPALEFLSPIKGPSLPNITVQVGSGISTAKKGAELYDQDVIKQAQQLGLNGW